MGLEHHSWWSCWVPTTSGGFSPSPWKNCTTLDFLHPAFIFGQVESWFWAFCPFKWRCYKMLWFLTVSFFRYRFWMHLPLLTTSQMLARTVLSTLALGVWGGNVQVPYQFSLICPKIFRLCRNITNCLKGMLQKIPKQGPESDLLHCRTIQFWGSGWVFDRQMNSTAPMPEDNWAALPMTSSPPWVPGLRSWEAPRKGQHLDANQHEHGLKHLNTF